MDMFSAEFFSALLAIIIIDLVLAGDNAIVIALVARKLPRHLQRITIIGGTVGAVAVRIAMTIAIVWLLNVPWSVADWWFVAGLDSLQIAGTGPGGKETW